MSKKTLHDYVKDRGVLKVKDVVSVSGVTQATICNWYNKGHYERIDALILKVKEQGK